MRVIKPCPFCLSPQTFMVELGRHEWAVVCESCGASGPITEIPATALDAWGNPGCHVFELTNDRPPDP